MWGKRDEKKERKKETNKKEKRRKVRRQKGSEGRQAGRKSKEDPSPDIVFWLQEIQMVNGGGGYECLQCKHTDHYSESLHCCLVCCCCCCCCCCSSSSCSCSCLGVLRICGSVSQQQNKSKPEVCQGGPWLHHTLLFWTMPATPTSLWNVHP